MLLIEKNKLFDSANTIFQVTSLVSRIKFYIYRIGDFITQKQDFFHYRLSK